MRILPATALLSRLRGLPRRGMINSVFPHLLFALVALPVGLFAFVLFDQEMRAAALYLAPAIVALLIIAVWAWRNHEERESTIG